MAKITLVECKGKVVNNADEKKNLSNKTSSNFYMSVLQQSNPLNTFKFVQAHKLTKSDNFND